MGRLVIPRKSLLRALQRVQNVLYPGFRMLHANGTIMVFGCATRRLIA